jgi:hypothetical protein
MGAEYVSVLERSRISCPCLAPRGDTFAPTVTELSVDEYGFLEKPEFIPKFGSGKSGENDENIWS